MRKSFADLPTRWAFTGFDYKNPEEIYLEHAALTKGTNIDISELNYDILKERRSVQWPYTKEINGSGTPRLIYRQKILYSIVKRQIFIQ